MSETPQNDDWTEGGMHSNHWYELERAAAEVRAAERLLEEMKTVEVVPVKPEPSEPLYPRFIKPGLV